MNNLVIAFIINSFLAQLAVFRERTDEEVVGDGEAVLRSRRAIFDATYVTGTSTGLSGDYIARIRHSANSDIGENNQHHQDRLRKLFTRSSSSNVDSKHSARSLPSIPTK